MSTDQAIEKEIQAKGLTAPRITPADIEANIGSEHYFTAAQGDAKAQEDAAFSSGALNGAAIRQIPDSLKLLTFCVLVLRNGFTVIGESACASPENFDAEVGRKIARQNAINKVWPLMGYELRSKLASCEMPDHALALRRALTQFIGVSTRADIREFRVTFEEDVTGSPEDIQKVLDCLAVLEQTATE